MKTKRKIEILIDDNGCHNCISHMKHDGYIRVQRNGKMFLLHRIVYSESYLNGGEIPNGLIVRHKCDNRACINPQHLEIGTPKDNSDDKIKRGRFRNGCEKHKGESHSNSLLKESDIIEIFFSKNSRHSLSQKYNVHKEHIGKIQRGKSWKHVTKNLVRA